MFKFQNISLLESYKQRLVVLMTRPVIGENLSRMLYQQSIKLSRYLPTASWQPLI